MGFDVVVVGSCNVDVVALGRRLPRPGETVLSERLLKTAGGKGANQASAAARAGARTALVAAVGDDSEAAVVLGSLRAAAVGLELVRRVPGPTGAALIVVGEGGENQIAVVPAANAGLVRLTAADRQAVRECRVLLLQLEVPLPVVEEAARLAREAGATVILNAAPPAPLPEPLRASVDILLVNESEAAVMGDLDLFPAVVVSTGSGGAVYWRDGGEQIGVPAPAVEVVDTTAAGDTLAGYLAAGLAEGLDLDAALRLAIAAASLAVTRPGAAASIPQRWEVAAWR